MKDSLIIKFLYQSVPGRILLKFLVHPKLSKAAAVFFSRGCSKWLVPIFIRKNKIDISKYEIPPKGYKSFNDFFTRKLRADDFLRNCDSFVSPCDGLLTVSEITKDYIFHIKHTDYSVKELLQDKDLAEKFLGGTAYIFRLTPAHYHRYSFCTSGVLTAQKRIDGVLHSVQPVCHEMTDVFIQNSREYSVIDSPENGIVLQMEVGALLVGKISNHDISLQREVRAGQEKGYFEYGGSSIVVLTQKMTRLSDEILHREKIGDEIPVRVGENLNATRT